MEKADFFDYWKPFKSKNLLNNSLFPGNFVHAAPDLSTMTTIRPLAVLLSPLGYYRRGLDIG
jgi:hypothetical protein